MKKKKGIEIAEVRITPPEKSKWVVFYRKEVKLIEKQLKIHFNMGNITLFSQIITKKHGGQVRYHTFRMKLYFSRIIG